jgi:lipid II:glycine glycyltransferase (peptidoglycan interpeptide bridge formation enzyme)
MHGPIDKDYLLMDQVSLSIKEEEMYQSNQVRIRGKPLLSYSAVGSGPCPTHPLSLATIATTQHLVLEMLGSDDPPPDPIAKALADLT